MEKLWFCSYSPAAHLSDPDPRYQNSAVHFSALPRLLVIDLKLNLSGPTNRTLNLASHLTDADVTLAVPTVADVEQSAGAVRLLSYAPDGEALRSALASHDVLLVHTLALRDFPFL